MPDLACEGFKALRSAFFSGPQSPTSFKLRDKKNTQDDPLDEYISGTVLAAIGGVTCVPSSGPLISPDLALVDTAKATTVRREKLSADQNAVLAIEVKKLERPGKKVARASGLDYNSTPPCGVAKVSDKSGAEFLVRSYYLFVCLEPAPAGASCLTALALVDGNLLNDDQELYLSIVGQRTKEIGLGTYGDGVNRNRPMLIFGNPLGIPQLDHQATLVDPRPGLSSQGLVQVGELMRATTSGTVNKFYAYRVPADAQAGGKPFTLTNPFPTPSKRQTKTQGRGRFVLPL